VRQRKKRREGPPKLERPTIPAALAIRMFVVGALAILASAWAIHRHYFVARPPMVAPATSVIEIPAPELEP
jgi:hypothetical protein